ncbi:hypothetical protein MMC31_003685 [Peltigera leucophlebia]|nr:hypothetical protein [Peltigera leucophlebia]
MRPYHSALVAVIFLSSFAHAHSWVEQLTLISPNGSFVGTPGYARGNVLRTAPNFGDPLMVNLLPPDGRPATQGILDTDFMCKDSQRKAVQTDGSPRLQAAAGNLIALRYQENGHVTLPKNQPGKPANRGSVFIYGTTQPSEKDTFLAIHKQWNAAGTGGDKRGKLLATQPFDDSQCYQINGGDISVQRKTEFPHDTSPLTGQDIWCQNDIAIPSDAPLGKPYTLYWVWDWPTAAGADPGLPKGKPETYTTCMDIDITSQAEHSSDGDSKQKNINFKAVTDGSIDNMAIPKYMQELTDGSQSSLPAAAPLSESKPPQTSQAVTQAQPPVESKAAKTSQVPTNQPKASSSGLPTESKAPQLPTVKPSLGPLAPVTVTVTNTPNEKVTVVPSPTSEATPAVFSLTMSVIAAPPANPTSQSPATGSGIPARSNPIPSAATPSNANPTSNPVPTTVTPTLAPGPTTLIAILKSFTGTASALPLSSPSSNPTSPSPSTEAGCNGGCKPQKRSRIFGSAQQKP